VSHHSGWLDEMPESSKLSPPAGHGPSAAFAILPDLKPHQQDLLDHIRRVGKLPTSGVDGRVLRALQRLQLVTVAGGFVFPCSPADPATGAPPILSERQAAMLRAIVRATDAVPQDELDGRTLNALVSRGLLVLRNGQVTPTDEGRSALATPRPSRRRRGTTSRHARAASILRSVEQLEAALPAGAEVLVGPIMAAAEDVVDGFRLLARRLEREAQ
jgi:hypothetical protein